MIANAITGGIAIALGVMIYTPQNSTNPTLWGKQIKFKPNGATIGDFKLSIPDGFDFITALFPQDPSGAKQYFNGHNT